MGKKRNPKATSHAATGANPPEVILSQFADRIAAALRASPAAPFHAAGRGGYAGAIAPLATGDYDRMVEESIRDSLGELPKDPQSLLAALNKAFSPREEHGKKVWEWKRRSYAPSMHQARSITAPQAELLAQAQRALDDLKARLDTLTPLEIKADPQKIEGAKSVLRITLTDLVRELQQDGGPRPAKAGDLAARLVEPASGLVTQLGLALGMLERDARDPRKAVLVSGQPQPARDQVDNLQDYENLTSFILLQESLRQVHASWNTYLSIVENDLGVKLLQLERTLELVEEAVTDLTAVMDQVAVGPAERLSILIDYDIDGVKGSIALEELINWIAHFAGEDAQQLLRGGMRQGMLEVKTRAQRLVRFVERLEDIFQAQAQSLNQRSAQRRTRTLPDALLDSQLLQQRLGELHTYLDLVVQRAT